ncbi:CBS domain-containing protein [Clostridium sp. 19966]|uniref:CBS domain-containing protein n=1 Tax=Clostridium sp. 19966 TaxID=2768166 RepID=UPI0028DF6F0D|nr:CBS domain-containing protein [Clostridium sp. 19966]MDT8716836.1 CBS domain-containing protein [Clostridium sp. 19966]
MVIKDIMKTKNYTVKVNDTIDGVLALMNKLHINGLPVIDELNNLVGMVVKADIYRFMTSPGHYDSCPVDWVMSKSVITVSPEEDILAAAKKLREKNIISMPVVEEGKVIGIISIEDLLDYFSTRD